MIYQTGNLSCVCFSLEDLCLILAAPKCKCAHMKATSGAEENVDWKKKKMHTLKAESYVLFGGCSEDFNPGTQHLC